MDIQNKLLDQLKAKLPPNASLGAVLMEDLNLSRDSAYRRARGETVLKPEEIKILCEKYNLSIDKIIGVSGQNVTFQYNPINRSDFSFEAYLNGILDAFKRMSAQRSQELYMSNLDFIIFQLLNSPILIRFKLMYFGKCYLKLPELQDQKFHKEWKGGISDEQLRIMHHFYTKVKTTEVIGFDAGKGIIREIVSFHEMGFFESEDDALYLIDEVSRIINHMEEQAKIGKKFVEGQPIVTEEGNFTLYMHQTYIQDNTFISETNAYRMLYITHNMINYLYTIDQDYVNKSFAVFKSMLQSCVKISIENQRQRIAYFDSIRAFTDRAKQRIGHRDLF